MKNNGLERFMVKVEQFMATHKKVMLPEQKTLIHRQYKQLVYEFKEQELYSTYEEVEDGITIKITTTSLITCDESGHSLNFLIGIANISNIEVIDSHVVFSLWFRCWEWIDKN